MLKIKRLFILLLTFVIFITSSVSANNSPVTGELESSDISSTSIFTEEDSSQMATESTPLNFYDFKNIFRPYILWLDFLIPNRKMEIFRLRQHSDFSFKNTRRINNKL